MSKHFSHDKKHHNGPVEGTGADTAPGAESGAAAQDQNGAGGFGPGNSDGGGDSAPAGAEDAQGAAAPEDRIADLEAQLAEAKDQFLRKAADFENFRKRMNREKQDAIDFANQSLLSDLIPVLDDFDRALQSAENSRDFDALYEGVGMIAKRLSSTLESKWGLKSYAAAGVLFDPNFHEALMMEKSSAVSEQTVQADLLKGYTLKDRVIRSAKVKVLIPDPSAPAITVPSAPAITVPSALGEAGTGACEARTCESGACEAHGEAGGAEA
jgi:molecular chaperone GrpE